MQAKGMTPIAKSLELAANDFPVKQGAQYRYPGQDGEESCGGDPCCIRPAAAARLDPEALCCRLCSQTSRLNS